MGDEYDHDYPPSQWTTAGITETLREREATYPIPTYDEASFWQSICADDAVQNIVTTARKEASEIANEPIEPLPASGYLRYKREGRRKGYPDSTRRKNLSKLAFAECIDREGDYLDPILDYIWAICEQSTWTQPAHLSEEDTEYLEGLPRPVEPEDHRIALRSAGTAKLLAEITYVLGDQLHPAVRERVHHEIDQRVLTSYLANDDFSWFHPPANNWNAVCNGSVLIAALHAEDDAERQARIVQKATGSIRHYLNGFDEDGGTAEGIGYWKYGFGFYTQAAAHLEERTDGEYSLFSPSIVRKIASFPLRIELSPNRFPAFSDVSEETDITPYIACKLGQRLDHSGLAARGLADLSKQNSVGYFSSAIRNVAWSRFEIDEDPALPPKRSFFEGQQWWIARTDLANVDGLVVAAKGGHNGESHNHNDCGSFVCHYRGESLLTDPGSGTYDSEYFGENRYEYFTTRSLGHSVPYVNGFEQAAGREFGATLLDRTVDDEYESLALDLAGCYPAEAGLDSLRREFTLDRTAGPEGQLRVSDEARFETDSPEPELETMLVSKAPITTGNDCLIVTGDHGKAIVTPDKDLDTDTAIQIERVEETSKDWDIWRARLRPPTTGKTISLTLTIEPEPIE